MANLIGRQFNGQGYFLNDDRASGGQRQQDDVIGCAHQTSPQCTPVMKKQVWLADACYCPRCDKPVCQHCHARIHTHGCEPFMKTLERRLADFHRQKQNARVLGI